MSKPLLQHALQYLASGKSVFPVIITADGKKRPLVKWKRFQTKLPTQDEVKSWWQRWPDACIGLICGFISGVSVIDVDPRNGGSLEGKSLPAGPCSRTLHSGSHHFFKPPIPLRTRCNILPGVDFKGEGGYVVLPPSPGYTWIQEPAGELPELPGNFEFDEKEPDTIRRMRRGNEPFKGKWDKEHWRYYRWSYYRNIEHVDAEIGRVLEAIEEHGHLNDTLIVMTADHGEGMGHHQMVRKSSFYDESARVPLLFSWPGHIAENKTDAVHLASGLDIMPTLCDYAGIQPPANMRGVSLRTILEAHGSLSRDFIVSEASTNTGRMVRTENYKYITYKDNLIEQLFDMKTDPGETKNLAGSSRYASPLAEHRKLLKDWENQLDVPSNVPNANMWRHKG